VEPLQEGSVELVHLNILLNFIETQFATTIESVDNLRPQNLISYDTWVFYIPLPDMPIIPLVRLWTLFRPGTIIHSKIRGYDRAFKLEEYWTIKCGQQAGFYSTGIHMDYDGENFGYRDETLKIPPFTGSIATSTLPFAPLEMRPRKEEIRMALMKRGERFQSMRGQCHGEYVGVAIEEGEESDKKFSVRPIIYTTILAESSPHQIKSRVMIDGTSYNRFCADHSWEASEDEEAAEALFWAEDSLSVEEFTTFKAEMAAKKAARQLTEEELLLATNVLRGFSFNEKKWFQLFIDNYSEIVWNEVCAPSCRFVLLIIFT
jgi:hypothetical protein